MQITISADSLLEFTTVIGELHNKLNSVPSANNKSSGPLPPRPVPSATEQAFVPEAAEVFGGELAHPQFPNLDIRPLNTGVDVDVTGIPWDGRIHASSRAKIADGKWRTKRGVTDAQVATVQAELMNTWGSPNAPTPTPTPTPTPPPPPATGVDPFLTLMKGVTAQFNTGAVTLERINEVLAPLGIPAMPALAKRPDLIPQVADALGVAL